MTGMPHCIALVVGGQEEQVHGIVIVILGEHQDQAQGLQQLIWKSNEMFILEQIMEN